VTDELRDQVRERYAAAATAVGTGSSCCADGCCGGDQPDDFGEALYTGDQRGVLPEEALLASLGCGNPTAVADLHVGESVLDLGSGGGIDVILSARRVGPRGHAYGLDMTDEMLEPRELCRLHRRGALGLRVRARAASRGPRERLRDVHARGRRRHARRDRQGHEADRRGSRGGTRGSAAGPAASTWVVRGQGPAESPVTSAARRGKGHARRKRPT
jgi:SAM-dependent methyltransferase